MHGMEGPAGARPTPPSLPCRPAGERARPPRVAPPAHCSSCCDPGAHAFPSALQSPSYTTTTTTTSITSDAKTSRAGAAAGNGGGASGGPGSPRDDDDLAPADQQRVRLDIYTSVHEVTQVGTGPDAAAASRWWAAPPGLRRGGERGGGASTAPPPPPRPASPLAPRARRRRSTRASCCCLASGLRGWHMHGNLASDHRSLSRIHRPAGWVRPQTPPPPPPRCRRRPVAPPPLTQPAARPLHGRRFWSRRCP